MLLICLVRWCPYCFLTSRLVPKIMADDLVIMVGRNHIFVEDQMTRRGDLWLNRKKNIIPLNVAYSYFASSLCVFYLSLRLWPIVSTRTIIHYRWLFSVFSAWFSNKHYERKCHGNDAWMDRNPAADGFFVLLQQHITHTRWGKGLWGPRASMDIDCFPKALPRPWTLHPGRKGWSNPHTTRRGRAATIKVKDVV